jgi:hypothetical protein
MLDLMIVDRCFVMAYQNTANTKDNDNDDNRAYTNVLPSLLAVGTVNGLTFYETSTYSLVHEVERNGHGVLFYSCLQSLTAGASRTSTRSKTLRRRK